MDQLQSTRLRKTELEFPFHLRVVFMLLAALSAFLALPDLAWSDTETEAVAQRFAGYWVEQDEQPKVENVVRIQRQYGRWMIYEGENKTYVGFPRADGSLLIVTGKEEPYLGVLDPASSLFHMYELDGSVVRISEQTDDPFIGRWLAIGHEKAVVEISRNGTDYLLQVLVEQRAEDKARLVPKFGGLQAVNERDREEGFLFWNRDTELLDAFEPKEVLRRLTAEETQRMEKLFAVPEEVRAVLAVLQGSQGAFQERTGQFALNLEALDWHVPQSQALKAIQTCRWQFATDGKTVTAQALEPVSQACPIRRVIVDLTSGAMQAE